MMEFFKRNKRGVLPNLLFRRGEIRISIYNNVTNAVESVKNIGIPIPITSKMIAKVLQINELEIKN